MRKFNVFYNMLGWKKLLVVQATNFFDAAKLAETKVKFVHRFAFVLAITAQI